MPWNLQTLLVRTKQVGAAVTAVVVISTAYVSMGGPVPATVSDLNSRDLRFSDNLRALTVLVLEGHRELFETRKDMLNAQLFDLERLPESSFNAMRLGKIKDDISQLNERDEKARKRIEQLKGLIK